MTSAEFSQELPLFMQQDFREPGVREEYVTYMTDLLSRKIVEKSKEWGVKLRGVVQSIHTFDRLVAVDFTVNSLGIFGRTKETAELSICYAPANVDTKEHWSGYASF